MSACFMLQQDSQFSETEQNMTHIQEDRQQCIFCFVSMSVTSRMRENTTTRWHNLLSIVKIDNTHLMKDKGIRWSYDKGFLQKLLSQFEVLHETIL